MFAKNNRNEESQISGLYLGWVTPEDGQWQPLLKTVKISSGFQSGHTRAFQRLAPQYQGMAYLLSLPTLNGEAITATIPDIFTTRMPRQRPDVERRCKFLGLSYPNIDYMAFVARTGGTIVGDGFDICPIMEQNTQGDYQFYCLLHEVDRDIRAQLWHLPELQCTLVSEQRTIVTAAGNYLGLLPPYFSLMGDNVTEIKLINISDDFYLGDHTLVSVTTKLNIYAHPCFELASERVAA
jgi:hypothetical protein